MPCFGCCNVCKSRRLKTVNSESSISHRENSCGRGHTIAIPNRNVWTEPAIARYCDRLIDNTKFCTESTNLLSRREVSLFDLRDSQNRRSKFENMFELYLSERLFTRKPSSVIIGLNMKDLDLNDIIIAYRFFGSFGGNFHSQTPSIDEFKCHLFRNIEIRKDTLFPDDKENSFRTEPKSAICFESRWLNFLSWWKMASDLNKLSLDVSRNLKTKTNQTKAKTLPSVTEIVDNLDRTLGNLLMNCETFEMAAVQHYVNLSEPQLDIKWPINRHSELGLLENINRDFKRIEFIVECSYQIVQIIFLTMKLLRTENEASNLACQIEMILEHGLRDLYYVFKNNDDQMAYSSFLKPLTKASRKTIDELIYKLSNADQTEGIDFQLQSSTNLVIRTLTKLTRAVVKNCPKYFDDASDETTINFVLNHMRLIITNGIILAENVFQKGFITEDLLLKMSQHEVNYLTNDNFKVNCVRMAYCFVTAHKIEYDREQICDIPLDYIRHDFLAFLVEIEKTSGFLPMEADNISFHYSLQLRILTDRMARELSEELVDIVSLIDRTKMIIRRSKHSGIR